ncbi:MAG TPA: RNA polymerase sigma factor, partial [Micromonosporaceae bacterium]|nr:RNA polymerase sigma factor [Micromonosporaceae bacterium]
MRADDPVDDFAGWVEPHLPAMAHLAARLAPYGDRDDVVQEALVRAWRRRSTFDPQRGTALAWLLAIVADRARRARVRRRFDLIPVPAVYGSGRDVEADLDLERALHALPPREQAAIALFYFVGLDVPTTAQVMACAEGTV